MLPTTLRVWVSSLPPASLCAPLSSGIMAISGIAAMSWNSRMAKARRPWGWVSSLRSARICRPKAVDDSARPRPSTTALFTGWSKPTRATVPITRPVSSTCSRPTPNTDLRITHRRRGDSSRPMMNSSNTTPISEICATLSGLSTRPSTLGPISTPASR